MFYLCLMKSSEMQSIFGDPMSREPQPGTVTANDLGLIMIGQKTDCSEYIALARVDHPLLHKLTSIPDRFDFIFRQEWGLRITPEILHRVIDTLRAESYPPMSDYLDGLVKHDMAQIEKYVASCKAVKEKYPKLIGI